MAVTLALSVSGVVLMIACAALNLKIKKIPLYPFVTLFFAILVIALGKLPFKTAIRSLVGKGEVSPVKILVLFLSMTFISVYLDENGFFKFVALKALERAGTSQKKLFFLLYLTVSVLTVFTSNDVVILSLTPFIIYFCKHAKINPVPYLVAEFIGANTFSMTFIIGNPTNIYLGLLSDISFGKYFIKMYLASLFGGVTAFAVCFGVFYKKLKTPISAEKEVVTINKVKVIIAGVHLALCTLCLALSKVLRLEMWAVSLGFAISLLVVVSVYDIVKGGAGDLKNTGKRMPWAIIPFLISMFVLVCSCEKSGITAKVGKIMGENVFSYGIVSAFSCNLINNIPMSVFFGSVLQNASSPSLIYACIIGSNVGAYFTPIGALAGIMWVNIINDKGIKFNYLDFIKYGLVIGIPTLIASLAGLVILL